MSARRCYAPGTLNAEDDPQPRPNYAPRPLLDPLCARCRLFHPVDMKCEVARAEVDAHLFEAGEEIGDEELEGVDRIALQNALRCRGLAFEVAGEGWWRVIQVRS